MVKKNNICISLVVAAAENGVIGRNNELPWHLPKDLGYFKQVTTGKVVLMGRKTFESIGRPLPNRTNIVVTRQPAFVAEGTIIVQSLQQGLATANEIAYSQGDDELMVIGGAQIYMESIAAANRLYLTRVHADVEGDAYFPAIEDEEWREVKRESHGADSKNPYGYSFVILDRVDTPGIGA